MSYSGNYYRPSMFGGFSFFPPVIKMLLIVNTAVFVLYYFVGSFRMDGVPLNLVFDYYLGLMPLGHGFWPWQLITYQFMHANFLHLLFNMVFGLWMFGMEVENTWGSRKFLIFYLTCGVVAGISQLILAPILEPAQTLGPTVGASGAVFGVLVAFGMMFPDRYIFLYFLVPIRAKYFVLIMIALGVWSVGGTDNVANLAHLGGALAGYLYMLYDLKGFKLRARVRGMQNPFAAREKRESAQYQDVVDAKVFDIREAKTDDRSDLQKRIDEILDKISQSGYQSLTEEEKKILFEASKKLN
ncbi:MAG TPA: rhomboid family intramembrane serine protease [Bacteroidota bacterium]|nr:rhomboid family intramembrane serine protease [Bacteroidota bacterium]